MVLKYSFEYLSNNNTLIDFLIRIADESNRNFEVIRNNSVIDFYCEGDADQLTALADKISTELPMSMFVYKTDVTTVDAMPESSSFEDREKNYTLPFCPKCLHEVENSSSLNYSNPFYTCDICNNHTKKEGTITLIEANQTSSIDDYPQFFKELAARIAQGSKIKIETRSGHFIFQKLNLEPNSTNRVMCTNLMNLSNVFVAKKSEVVALASLEKPRLNLRLNEVYKQKYNSNINEAQVSYVSDLFLYLLSQALKEEGIDFLSYDEQGDFDCQVETGFCDDKTTPTPFIKVTNDDRVILLENSDVDEKLMSMYQKFEDKNKGHFMVLLQENNLFESSIINFYTSSLDDDNVSIYTNNIGSFLDILNYKLPSSMEELFNEIQRDDTGKRLFENYKNKFPENIEKASAFDLSSVNQKSIVSLWRIVRQILGFETTVLNHATACLLEKGPRLDYKFYEQEKIYNKEFDFIKLIRSGMSFKLAGVDDNAIALGYIESYAHFISSIVDEVNSEIPLDGISLCGDIFANNLISNFVHKSITKNYKIYYNKDFVIQVS